MTADITMDGQTATTTFEVEQGADHTRAVDGWTIKTGPRATIHVGSVTQVTKVNGVAVDLSAVPIGAELPALPGIYRFTAPTGTDLLSYGDDLTVKAGIHAGSDTAKNIVAFTAHPTRQAEQSAVEAVRARVAHCMISDAFRPTDCPNVLEMKDPGTYATTSITRSWTTPPSLSSSPAGLRTRSFRREHTQCASPAGTCGSTIAAGIPRASSGPQIH